MPSFVLKTLSPGAATPQAAHGTSTPSVPVFAPQIAPRNCRLQGYEPREIPGFEATGRLIAYVSPDCTWEVTRSRIEEAEESILIGIYDFSAPHVQDALEAALARGVKVGLMLDIDSERESDLFDELVRLGVRGVPAPSCAHDTVRVFRSSHEKVIVVDGRWTLVQSGNYSNNSIPLNELGSRRFRTGNRDAGLVIESEALATFFTELLEADMALVEAEPQMLRRRPPEEAFFLVESAPKGPAETFASLSLELDGPLQVTPVISPDNYMAVVPSLLRGATASIHIEQQYIRADQAAVEELLTAIAAARDASPNLQVRIVLGKIFDKKKLPAERANLQRLEERYGLRLGEHIRYINTNQFVHCHNKMVLVDGEGVLVSSQNWSSAALTKNREAGVWLQHPQTAAYFEAVFAHDWEHAFQTLPDFAEPEVMAPESLGGGGFLRVERADYDEV